MKNNYKPLFDYCTAHTSVQSELLHELERETHLKTLSPGMLSGHYQGRILSMFSRMMRPQTILELGTFTGYSALCLAEGLPENGKLHTIEVNEELEKIISKYIVKSGLESKVVLHIGDAAQVVPKLSYTFDLAFIDAGKHDYEKHYEMVIKKMNPGGVILADNVLWFGKVFQGKMDVDAKRLRKFNAKIKQDTRVENVMLPVRDGILMIRVK